MFSAAALVGNGLMPILHGCVRCGTEAALAGTTRGSAVLKVQPPIWVSVMLKNPELLKAVPTRVNVAVPWERDWWCKTWNVSEAELRAAVSTVGASTPSVARHLGRRIPVGKPTP